MAKNKQKTKSKALTRLPKIQSWSNPKTQKLIKQVSLLSLLAQILFYLYSEFIGGYPIIKYMFLSAGRFDDLRNGLNQNQYFFNPRLLDVEGFASVASPPMISIWQFYGVFVKSESMLIASLIATFLVLVLIFWLITKNVYVTIFLATLHPILFTFARGNPDMWVLILLGIAGIGFLRDKNWLVAIAFGLMSALKFPYLLFGVIFLMKKDYKNLALQFAVTTIAFLLPLNSRPWGAMEQIKVFNGIVAKYFDGYVLGDGGLLFNISFFGFEKPLLYLMKGDQLDSISKARDVATFALTLQLILLIVLSVMFLAFPIYYELKNKGLIKKPVERAKEMELYLVFFLFLAVIQCLYPQVSAEYRLAQLVVIIALLFKVKSGFLENRTNLIILTLICLPKHFMVISFPSAVANIVTISSLLTPPLLILLAVQIQIYLSKGSFYSPFIRFLNLSKNRA